MARAALGRTENLASIPSAEDRNVILTVTDYFFDDDSGRIILAANYNDGRTSLKEPLTLEVKDDCLDYTKYPNSFGKLYVFIHGHVFFIDDAHDYNGQFDEE